MEWIMFLEEMGTITYKVAMGMIIFMERAEMT
jgi:hypothetical protein